MKQPKDWPDRIAKSVTSVKVREEFLDGAKIGEIKELRLACKLKASELIGKNLSLFVDRVEHSGKITLEDLVAASYGKAEESK